MSHSIMAKQLRSVQNPIKEESDEEWKETDSPSCITDKNIRDGRPKARTQNFATEDWDKYNSGLNYGLHSLDERNR